MKLSQVVSRYKTIASIVAFLVAWQVFATGYKVFTRPDADVFEKGIFVASVLVSCFFLLQIPAYLRFKSGRTDIPYVEYLNRVYHDKPTSDLNPSDWRRERDGRDGPTLDGRLRDVLTGGERGASLSIDAYTVHAFFDRLQHALPDFVPVLPAAGMGSVAALAVLRAGYDLAVQERAAVIEEKKKQDSELWERMLRDTCTLKGVSKYTPQRVVYAAQKYALSGGKFERVLLSGADDIVLVRLMEERWRIILLLSLLAAIGVGKAVLDYTYLLMSLASEKNRKHWAAIKFSKEYARSLGDARRG